MKPRDGPAAEVKEAPMTTKTKASTTERPQATAEPRRPTHRLYRVTGDGDASI